MILGAGLMVAVIGVIATRDQAESQRGSIVQVFEQPINIEPRRVVIETAVFVDEGTVSRAWNDSSSVLGGRDCGYPVAGIVNHHVLAADLIARFFRFASACKPDPARVIVVSPDHYQTARVPIATARVDYGGSYTLNGDYAAVSSLLVAMEVEERPELFAREHGVASLAPFIARAWPGRPIVPLAVSSRLTVKQSKALSSWLTDQINTGAFVVISSDMSHYLPKASADSRDEETLRALSSSNEIYFWTARDDATDNGKAITTLLRSQKGATWKTLDHKISSDYGTSPGFTTSYITGLLGYERPIFPPGSAAEPLQDF